MDTNQGTFVQVWIKKIKPQIYCLSNNYSYKYGIL